MATRHNVVPGWDPGIEGGCCGESGYNPKQVCSVVNSGAHVNFLVSTGDRWLCRFHTTVLCEGK